MIDQQQEVSQQEIVKQKTVSYGRLFLIFLKAGSIGFGGFMALISVVESIVVKQLQLMKPEDMLDGISLANLLPGPQAVNVCAYTGNKLKGTWGAVIATVAIILPCFILMLILSVLYKQYGNQPSISRFLDGFLPAVVAIIVSVAWRMAKNNVKGVVEFLLTITSILAFIFVPKQFRLVLTFIIVIIAGFAGYFFFHTRKNTVAARSNERFPYAKIILVLIMAAVLIAGLYTPVSPSQYNSVFNLTKTFSGLSVMLFGGGYVIIPIMRHHVVEVFQWLNSKSFADCIAFSQVTPGPILIATTFIGYMVQGILGAFLCTIAIFAPPAIIMVVASQAMDYFKKSDVAKAVMKGIRCAVIGMIFFAAYELASNLPFSPFAALWPSVLIFAASLVALVRFKIDVVYIIPVAGVIGYFLYP